MSNGTQSQSDLFDPHWEMTQQHAGDISELKAGQARLEVGVQGLGSKLDTAIHSMNQIMTQVNRPPERPNLLGLVTTACVVGGLLGALAMSVVSPIKQDLATISERQYLHNQDIIDSAYNDGVMNERVSRLADRVDHLDELDHVRDEQIIQLREDSAASKVSRTSIGQYLKEHVNKVGDSGHPEPKIQTYEHPANR